MTTTSSKALFALGAFVIVVGNAYFISSGWVDKVSKLPSKTGIFILDLLLEFFPAVYATPSSRIVMDAMTIAVPASTAVIYEGSRRRGAKVGLNQFLVAAYWWVAQFVAIGLATPVFLGLYLSKPVRDTDYVHVGRFRVLAVLLGMLGTSLTTPSMEASILNGQPDSLLMLFWLVFPVVVISFGVALDRSTSAAPMSPNFIQLIPYLMGFAAGAVSHFRTIKVFMDGSFNLNDITSNPPCVFLIFDLLGLMLGAYIWIHADRHISVFSYWWIALVFGPGAHFSVLCAVRDRIVEGCIPVSDKKRKD